MYYAMRLDANEIIASDIVSEVIIRAMKAVVAAVFLAVSETREKLWK